MSACAAEIKGLYKTYRSEGREVPALKGVDLEIKNASLLAIMGASGSGKSTLLHLVAGLDQAEQGQILIGGKDLARLDDRALTIFRRQHIGIVFQAYNLIPVLTAEENVALPLILDGRDKTVALKEAQLALEQVHLAERRSHRPNQLSGGEQQRVAIARALICNPDLILADEPTGNLDSAGAKEITEIFMQLHQDGRTVVLVTHDAQLASHCESVHIMADGQLRGVIESGAFENAADLSRLYLDMVTAETV